ncbi:hypothetical protein BGX34_007470 [Mortierella sp. NVP85]|nr:hypothetical protein BGX34_007470 [Mortierella sp. NVP85]
MLLSRHTALLRGIKTPLSSKTTIRLLASAQAMTTPTEKSQTKTRFSEHVKQDHRELRDAYDNIMGGTSNDERTRWQNQFVWELARHSVGEELVVYPAFESHLENGKEMADKDRKDHRSVKEALYKFQNLKATDAEFLPTIVSLWEELSQHIKEEEENDLPALENALDEEASYKLGRSFQRTKFFAPTRSHPNAPDKPPFETAAGLLAAPMDQIKDLFSKFPSQSETE